MSEQLFKRSETRKRLNITKYRYFELVKQGILEPPIRLTPNSHPMHTESQITAAERELRRLSEPKPLLSKPRRSRPLSDKMFLEIARAYAK